MTLTPVAVWPAWKLTWLFGPILHGPKQTVEPLSV